MKEYAWRQHAKHSLSSMVLCVGTQDSSKRAVSWWTPSEPKNFYATLRNEKPEGDTASKGLNDSSWSLGVPVGCISTFTWRISCLFWLLPTLWTWSHYHWKGDLSCPPLKQKKKQRCKWAGKTLEFWFFSEGQGQFSILNSN